MLSGKVYLISGVTDMRKSIDGLSLIIAETLEMDPFSESWFIFCNRTRAHWSLENQMHCRLDVGFKEDECAQ